MYHFIGIGGIGMSGLARILLQQGKPVSGSDIALGYTVEALIKEGATIHKGHSKEHIHPTMTVVYGSDIKLDNPEFLAAKELGCPLLHRADLLANLTNQKQSLAVAGTHGKTTTSALLATVLMETENQSSFAVGGILPQYQANSHYDVGPYFAFEADESDQTFLKYFPYGAIVTNIDNDHLNNYEGQESLLIAAFKQFMDQVSTHLFWCGDDPYLNQLNHAGKRYGFSDGCDWQATNFRQNQFQICFDIEGDGQLYKDVEVACIGRYNATNALAVFGLALSIGIAEEVIRRAFKGFGGVMRRCELKGKINEITFLDDYAHHPTEIRVTLGAIREAIGQKRLVVIFQPHRYSRTKDCLGQYGSIFDCADEVIITDIFAAGEIPIAGLTYQQVMDEVKTVPIQYVPRSALSHFLSQFGKEGDVMVTLGAGDVTKVSLETIACLEKQAYSTNW